MVDRVRRGDWYGLLAARVTAGAPLPKWRAVTPRLGVGGANYTHAFYPSRLADLERRGGSAAAGSTQPTRVGPLRPTPGRRRAGAPGRSMACGSPHHPDPRPPRGDPLPLLGLVAAAPFLLSTTRVTRRRPRPLTLLLATSLDRSSLDGVPRAVGGSGRRRALAAAALRSSPGRRRAWELDTWVGDSEVVLDRHATGPTRPPRGDGHRGRTSRHRPPEPVLELRADAVRMVGKARFARDDFAAPSRPSAPPMALWPHEDTELFLGLALAPRAVRGRPSPTSTGCAEPTLSGQSDRQRAVAPERGSVPGRTRNQDHP